MLASISPDTAVTAAFAPIQHMIQQNFDIAQKNHREVLNQILLLRIDTARARNHSSTELYNGRLKSAPLLVILSIVS